MVGYWAVSWVCACGWLQYVILAVQAVQHFNAVCNKSIYSTEVAGSLTTHKRSAKSDISYNHQLQWYVHQLKHGYQMFSCAQLHRLDMYIPCMLEMAVVVQHVVLCLQAI